MANMGEPHSPSDARSLETKQQRMHRAKLVNNSVKSLIGESDQFTIELMMYSSSVTQVSSTSTRTEHSISSSTSSPTTSSPTTSSSSTFSPFRLGRRNCRKGRRPTRIKLVRSGRSSWMSMLLEIKGAISSRRFSVSSLLIIKSVRPASSKGSIVTDMTGCRCGRSAGEVIADDGAADLEWIHQID